MDKYDIVLDIIEHPEKYTSARLSEMLSDPETREIYNVLVKTQSAAKSRDTMSSAEVEEEWKRFERAHPTSRFRFLGLSGRAASIALLIVSSVVAFAVGITIKVSLDRGNTDEAVVVAARGDAAQSSAAVRDTIAPPSESPSAKPTSPVLFDNASLGEIIETIAKTYGVKARFEVEAKRQLRLFYKFDPNNTLQSIVDQLNNFEQIDITLEGSELVVR